MIWLYRLLFVPAFLLAFSYYAVRMLRRGGYSKDFSHRLGGQKKLPPKSGKKRVWLQAVSVGEIEALASLIDMLSSEFELVVTTTTSTAYKILREKYAAKCLYVGVFPIDFWLFSARAWEKINPDVCLLMEGELWPEHMHQAKSRGAKIMLLNARMSDKSFGRYAKFPYVARRLLDKFDAICASSEFDAARFIRLGASPLKVFTTGNMKFDSKPATVLDENGKAQLRAEMGFAPDSLVLLGSSTWDGEEEMLLKALDKIRADKIDCRLLLVPRHAERRNAVKRLIAGYPHGVRSESKTAPEGTLVYLADTTGELRNLTQIADFAFVGKSLPPNVGGQTPIDCAALGVPIVYGPNMTNFRRACETLERDGAVVKVPNAECAVVELARLAKNPHARETLAQSAKKWHSSNVGASARTFAIIEDRCGK